MRKNSLLLAAAMALFTAQPAAAADSNPYASLDEIDCSVLKIDYVRMMPEMIEPQTFVPRDPPFSAADLTQLDRSGTLDPNGLCHYRDANRKLPATSRNRVVFIGDSITEYWQLGDPELFGNEVIDRGISSQTTGQMLLRFQHDVIALHPRVVHIMGGINDAMSPNGTLSTRNNIIAMVELARAHGIKVILATLTPADQFWLSPESRLAPFVADYNKWLRNYAAREHIALVDYHAALATPTGAMTAGMSNDGLHPNRLGYRQMAKPARDAIAKVLRR